MKAIDHSLGFTLNASYYNEGVWFNAEPPVPGITTHRRRIFSVDTP